MVWEAWVALVPAGGVHVVRMQLLERVGHVPTSEAAASAGGTAPVVTPTNAAAETIATQDSDDRWKKVRRLVETARSVDGVYPWQPEWDRMAIPKIAATVAAAATGTTTVTASLPTAEAAEETGFPAVVPAPPSAAGLCLGPGDNGVGCASTVATAAVGT